MITLGITGGIGSGKSIVSHVLQTLGIPVYDSDSRAKWLNDHSPIIRKGLTDLIGSEVYDGECLRRDRLAAAIFASHNLLRQVNAIIHPEVKNDFLRWRASCPSDLSGLESAILHSSGFHTLCDSIIRVDAPEEIRIERATARDGASAEAIRKRIQSQRAEETAPADYIIMNAPPHLIIPQVIQIISSVRQKAQKSCLRD